MAKPNRAAHAQLPLSAAFFALLSQVGKGQRLPTDDSAAVIAAVRALSQTYTRERGALTEHALGERAELARLVFFLPRDLCKVFGPLEELVGQEPAAWARPLRVLDVGAGLGSTSLGIARYLALRGIATPSLELHAVERDPRALGLFRAVADALPRLGAEFTKLTLHSYARDAHAELPAGEFDLIACGLVLNELAHADGAAQIALLERLSAKLRPGGGLLVLEPASKASARALMATRDALIARGSTLRIVAPCTHRAPCPMLASERDWCHEELPFALPPALVTIAKGAGLRFEGLSYAALVLQRAALGATETGAVHYRVVSDPLPSKGKLELYGCGDHGYVRLTLLTRNEAAANRSFAEARRGDGLLLADRAPRITADTALTLLPGPRRSTR